MRDPTFTTEAVYAALFALVSGVADFKLKTRRLQIYADTPQDMQPALYQQETGVSFRPDGTMPPTVVLRAKLFIFCYQADDGANVSPQINTLIDAVLNALEPGPAADGQQTLGGLVYHCHVDGDCTIAEGLTGQSEVQIPVAITLNH